MDHPRPCRLNYHIECDESWRTRWAKVDGWVGNDLIEITMTVDAGGVWYLNGKEVPQVSGCIDIDLNFSPVTNLLPIRRLNLEVGQEAPVKAAWLRFPSFELELLEQTYRRVDPNSYRYESAGGKFVAELEVDAYGFPVNYPGFWQAER